MASNQMLTVLAVFIAAAAAVLPSAMGMNYFVGGDSGWKPDFNYTAWAEGKDFRVGDYLVFKYPQGEHNVISVGGAEFKACKANGTGNVFTTGHDWIPLKKDGKKWYICGFADHCQRGQKLVINVQAALSAAPTSPPLPPPPAASSATGVGSYPYRMLLAAAAAAMMILMA